MSDNWQTYKKIGNRWVTVGDPTSRSAAEAAVTAMLATIAAYEAECKDRRDRKVKRMPPEPGFREPHCVPV